VTADATFDASRRHSPVEGFDFPPGLREEPFLAQIDVRLTTSDQVALDAVESVIGPLPPDPNTFTGGADGSVLWLGPDEWLVVGPPSANRTALEVRGPKARAVLEGGCSIDLHPRAFGPGRCAQTLLARANVIVQQLTDEPVYRIFVRPSFATYLATWLTDALAPD